VKNRPHKSHESHKSHPFAGLLTCDLPTPYCAAGLRLPQYIGLILNGARSIVLLSLMDTKRLPTRWLYIMDYLDEDTGAVDAAVGSADDRDECEGVVRHETISYQRQGFTILRGEACELCRGCAGDGLIDGSGAARQCPQCGGFTGPFRRLRFKV
jgi:hypothetical protein